MIAPDLANRKDVFCGQVMIDEFIPEMARARVGIIPTLNPAAKID
jgi:hypothetical protein